MEKVTGEQVLLTSNISQINPLNLSKIQTAIKTDSSMLGASNLATFIFFTCPFHFWHLFCTTTIFYYWQGHVTLSCKEPIVYNYINTNNNLSVRTLLIQEHE